MIPFNQPYSTGLELEFISDAQSRGHLSGDGYYTKLCSNWIEQNFLTQRALLTHSCTAALEMAAILANISPGDEVIMPSYTFVSTANAFVLRGAVPVFVDIRRDTLNIDENLIEQAITSRTKAIVPVHYAGVPCEMEKIMEIAKKHGLVVIEDAAQAVGSEYRGRQLGTIGDFGCLSFHETKNIHCGEGGALLVNNEKYVDKAEIIREKGTDRSKYLRAEIDKYTWQSLGSSFLPSELNASFLYAQLNSINEILEMRSSAWQNYYKHFQSIKDSKRAGKDYAFELPVDGGNAHMFSLVFERPEASLEFRKFMSEKGVKIATHYVPLHSSPAGKLYGRTSGKLSNTNFVAEGLIRMPLYPDVREHIGLITKMSNEFFLGNSSNR